MKKILLAIGLVSLLFLGCPNEIELVAIKVTANKVDYTVGESIAPSDIEVVATYNDGTSKVVSDYTVTPSTFSEVGTISVTVTYTEKGVVKEANYSVVVAEEYTLTIHMLPAANIRPKLDKLGIGTDATEFRFTDTPPNDSVTKVRLSTEAENETPCWAWREGTIIYCYAKSYTDKGKKLPLETASSLFSDCKNLEAIDLRFFDTSKCTSMSSMFKNCKKVKTLDVTGFDTGNVTDFSRMFNGCEMLEAVDVSNFDTKSVTKGTKPLAYPVSGYCAMFRDCKALKSVDIINFDTSKNPSMNNMFMNCSSLTSFRKQDVTKWFKPSYMEYMFYGCSSLTGNWDFNGEWFDTSLVTSMEGLFQKCSKLETLNLDYWDVSKVTTMKNMFAQCSKLSSPWSFSGGDWDTSKVTDMSGMFAACFALDYVDSNLAYFNTSSVTNMHEMFWVCSSLSELDLSKWDISKVTDMAHMFQNCENLTKIYAAKNSVWKNLATNLTDSKDMFSGCTKLVGKDAYDANYPNDITQARTFTGNTYANEYAYFTGK